MKRNKNDNVVFVLYKPQLMYKQYFRMYLKIRFWMPHCLTCEQTSRNIHWSRESQNHKILHILNDIPVQSTLYYTRLLRTIFFFFFWVNIFSCKNFLIPFVVVVAVRIPWFKNCWISLIRLQYLGSNYNFFNSGVEEKKNFFQSILNQYLCEINV